jgi:hypothetical protein
MRALFSNTTRSNLVAMGDSALFNNGVGATLSFQAMGNTAVGSKALFANTTGFNNTANGADALFSNTTGSSNTANGTSALLNNTSGFSNVAVGMRALFSNTTRSNLVAVGDSALFNNGVGATVSNHGTGNTAVGSKALFANTTGFNNTAYGAAALVSNTAGNFNTANGSQALNRNTGGSSNTANGADALFSNTIGSSNTANGISALRFNTEGSNNTAIGADALLSNTAGNSNTAFGTAAGRNNQTGSGNVFIGNQAGFNETGSNKLYISNNSGNALLYGEFDTDRLRIENKLGIGRLPNTFPLEVQALAGTDDLLQFFNAAGTARWHLNLLPNGSLNFTESPAATNRLVLGIGGEVGVGKIPLTGSNDSRLVVKQKGAQNGIGMESSNSSNHWDFYVTGGTSSDLQLYYNGSIKGTFGNAGGVYTPSDQRLKKDIATYEPVLNKIQQLEAFHYHYLDNKSSDPLSTGFMAQDVQKLFPEAVSEMDMKNGEKMLGINYQYFTVVAIKGLQEQQKEIADMKLQLKLMMEEIEKLKKK